MATTKQKTPARPLRKTPAARKPTPAAKKPTPAKATATKPQARKEDSPLLEVRAEATPLPVDESNAALEKQRAELHKPGRVGKADAKQIDNDPGYSRDQLAHMREYFGIDPDESTVEAEQGAEVEELV